MGAIAVELNNPTARPFTSFNFLVEINVPRVSEKVCAAAFSECDGLEMNLELKTIREGGRNTGPIHLVGQVTYGQLTLRRGMTANLDLWRWFETVTRTGTRGVRGSGSIVVLGSEGVVERARFELEGCVPVKLKAPALNAKDGILAIEEMQIAYEAMQLASSGGGGGPAAAGAR